MHCHCCPVRTPAILLDAFCLTSPFRLQTLPLQYVYSMVFALEEINRSPTLLPGLKLGYHIRDSCALPTWAMRGAMTLVGGESATCDSEDQSDLSGEPGEERDKGRGALVGRKKVKIIWEITGRPFDAWCRNVESLTVL